jgi:prepilin-type N-terminal cleavage/methylation domain-containing protein
MIKKGFSLAEVLVAIGIIGILAIVLIPLLTKDTPSKNKVIFRKAYNSLAQIVANMINDDVNYPATRFDVNNIPRGFNYTDKTTNVSGTDTINKFCYFLSNQLNTVGTVTCPLATDTAGTTTQIFTMPDGATWYFKPGGNDSAPDTQFPRPPTVEASMYATTITVDIDGPYKGTNCSADGYFSSSYSEYIPTGVSPAPKPAYTNCTSATPATTPCEKNPDTFILGVRYDGKIYTGTTAGVDACAIDILRNPTSNTK